MDDLEFRRAVLADPNSEDDSIRDSAADDPVKQAFLTDMRQFDKKLDDALKVDVPENLAERLILRQTLESHQQQKRRNRVHIAMAASIAFAVGLSLHTLYSPVVTEANIGTYSLAHVSHGIDHLINARENNTLEQVNVKMARFGGQFTQAPAKAVFANYCNFDGITSLHLIFEDTQGRVSVFVTPSDANFDFVSEFSDDRFIGRGIDFEKAQVTVVGDKGKPIDAFTENLKSSLNWQI